MQLSQVLDIIENKPSHEILVLIAYAISEGRDKHTQNTVNAEIFARVYFRETSHMHMRSFVKIKSSQNGEITLSLTDTLYNQIMP